jgi:hypothetical protein
MIATLERLVGSVLGEITPYHQHITEISLATDLASLLADAPETPVQEQISALREKYLRERPRSRGVRPGRIFAQIYATEDELLRTWAEGGVAGKPPRKLRTGLKAFENAFEHYLRAPSATGSLHLFQVARDLSAALQVSQDLIDTLTATISHVSPTPSSQQTLELFLTNPSRISEIRSKLKALEQLYCLTAEILDVSPAEFPLTITHLEVGSLWIKLFGQSKVISMVTKFIEATVAFGYRNWTDEGRISALPKKIEAVEAVLEFSKRLEDAGLNTDELRGRVQRAAIQIADQLNDLLEGERDVEVNGRSLHTDDQSPKIISTPITPLMLGSGTGNGVDEREESEVEDQ